LIYEIQAVQYKSIHSKLSMLSFWVKVIVILSVAQFVRTVIFSQLDLSHVLNSPTAKNQYVADLKSTNISNYIHVVRNWNALEAKLGGKWMVLVMDR
jgi:hypothetical protein